MCAEILGAMVVTETGIPVRFQVGFRPGLRGDGFNPTIDGALDDENARDAFRRAHQYVKSVLGWPEAMTAHWSLLPANGPHYNMPARTGPSLFGMFSLALLQSVARDAPSSIKNSSKNLTPMIAGTLLHRVAVSAAFAPPSRRYHAGRFRIVGDIQTKLAELTTLGSQRCALCVVSKLQMKKLIRNGAMRGQKLLYRTFDLGGILSLPVVEAIDPLDAVQKIFTLQAVSGFTC